MLLKNVGKFVQLRKDQDLPPFVSITPSLKIKKVVDRSNSEFFRNTINLNGCNLDKYLSNHHSSPVDPRSHLVTDSTYNPTTTFKENDFYVHTLVPMSKKNSHAPTIVRKTFRALQQADPTFLLKPFDRNNKSSNDDISNPDKIPDDEKKIKKYVQGVSIARANKLRFSMRETNTISFKDLRACSLKHLGRIRKIRFCYYTIYKTRNIGDFSPSPTQDRLPAKATKLISSRGVWTDHECSKDQLRFPFCFDENAKSSSFNESLHGIEGY